MCHDALGENRFTVIEKKSIDNLLYACVGIPCTITNFLSKLQGWLVGYKFSMLKWILLFHKATYVVTTS